MKRFLISLLSGLLVIGNSNLVLAQDDYSSGAEEVILESHEIDPDTLHVKKLGETDEKNGYVDEDSHLYKLSDIVRVSIVLDEAATLETGYSVSGYAENQAARNYRSQLKSRQDIVTQAIESAIGEKLDVKWNLTLAVNIISANVKYSDINLIQKVSGVKDVFIENRYEAQEDDINTSNTSTGMVGAASAWNLGYTGAGMRIAIIDTGIDTSHQSFNADAFNYSINNLGKTVDVLDQTEINSLIRSTDLNAAGPTWVNSKIPYGYNYVDGNTTITHLSDTQGEHGSHVAGIAAANRYIKNGNAYTDAASSVKAVGMAPDAQLFVMKVFGAKGGAYDSDYMAAIEDALALGCDSVNLSLGSSEPGYTYSNAYQDVLNSLSASEDINLVTTISAGNSGALTDELSTDLYIDDISMHTGGSPGSFINSLCVASADNIGETGSPLVFNNNQSVYYTETESSGAVMSSIKGTYSYVYIDAYGAAADYQAVNKAVSLSGKIVIVNRGGDLAFTEKGNNAKSYSPKALIVANNQNGAISMGLDDYTGSFPFVSITLADAEAIKAAGEKKTTGSYTYYTGTVTVTDAISSGITGRREDTTVSDFSSWGVPGSLLMKPEIVTPGGNIYSVWGTNKTSSGTAGGSDKYELMSGTSMAAPHMAGLSAVLMQHLKENNIKIDGYSLRAVNQALMMSTATPMINNGQYVSILQQGSGLAEVSKAVSATSVIFMDETDNTLTALTGSAKDGKVKAELGDNPSRKADYTYSFTIHNLNDQEVEYELSTKLFTQAQYEENGDVFMSPETTGELIGDWNVSYYWEDVNAETHDADKNGRTDRNDVQAILDYTVAAAAGISYEKEFDNTEADLNKDGSISTDDAYLLIEWLKTDHSSKAGTVAANGSRKVTVTITPDDSLDEYYPSGAYVEGYTYINALTQTDDGASVDVEHTIPLLGFYGSWTDPSMFDNTSYVDSLYGTEKTPYSGKTTTNYMTLQYNGTSSRFSGNPYKAEASFPTERLAVNSSSQIDNFYYNLLRSAGTTGFAVSKTDQLGGNVSDVLSSTVSGNNVTGLWYDIHQGTWQNTGTKSYSFRKTPGSFGLVEGDTFRIGFYAIPEYNGMLENGNMNQASAGMLSAGGFRNVLLSNVLGKGAFLGYDFTVDNTAPVINEAVLNGNNLSISAEDGINLAYVAVLSLDGNTVYAEETPGKPEYTISMDASDAIRNAKGYVAVFAGDYAGNEAAVAVKVNNNTSDTDPYSVSGVSLTPGSLDLYKGNEADLMADVLPLTASDKSVKWSSSNTSVATVDESGHVTAVGAGSATITAVSNSDSTKKATASVKVTSVNKTLNGIVWDEEGEVYFSSFNTSALPSYTKLHNTPADKELVSAMMYSSSSLYAGTLDTANAETILYSVNRNNYSLSEYGTNYVAAFDMAPGASGSSYQGYVGLVYTFASYVIAGPISPEDDGEGGTYSGLPYALLDCKDTTGDAYFAGIACRSRSNSGGSYYLLDENGIIWQTTLTYTSRTGFSFSTPTKVVETGIGTSFLYQNLYYDGTYLYWSHQDGNTAELIIINPSSKAVYHAGTFDEGVWPVGGLYVNGSVAPASEGDETMDEAVPADLKPIAGRAELMSDEIMNRLRAEASKQNAGSLNNAGAYSSEKRTTRPVRIFAETAASEKANEENGNGVTIELNAKKTATNGLYKVTYDPSKMSFVSNTNNSEFSSYHADEEKGIVYVAYADSEGFAAEETVDTITFSEPSGSAQVVITSLEDPEIDEEVIEVGKDVNIMIAGHSLSLEGLIGVNFYIYIPEEEINDTDVKIEFDGNKEVIHAKDAPSRVVNGKNARQFSVTTAAKQMRDRIKVTVTDSEGKAKPFCNSDNEAVTDGYYYSVADYCAAAQGSTNEKLINLTKVMNNYGKYAQLYFNYNVDDEVRDTLPVDDVTSDLVSSYAMKANGSVKGITYKGGSLQLESSTGFRVYFSLESGHAISDYTFTVNGKETQIVKNGSAYYVAISDIAAKELDNMFTIAVTDGKDTLSIRYGSMSYLYTALNSSSASAEIINAGRALYQYWQAAKAYFAE